MKKAEDRFVVSDLVGPGLIDSRDAMRLAPGGATVAVRDGQLSAMNSRVHPPIVTRHGEAVGEAGAGLEQLCSRLSITRVANNHAHLPRMQSSLAQSPVLRDFDHPTLPVGA